MFCEKWLKICALQSTSHTWEFSGDKHSDTKVPAQLPEALALLPLLGKNLWAIGFVFPYKTVVLELLWFRTHLFMCLR